MLVSNSSKAEVVVVFEVAFSPAVARMEAAASVVVMAERSSHRTLMSLFSMRSKNSSVDQGAIQQTDQSKRRGEIGSETGFVSQAC